MPLITTQIEISSPPSRVREILLDFPNHKTWLSHNFTSITIPPPHESKSSFALQPGDKLNVVLKGGMAFSPIIQENTPSQLRWLGSLPYIFSGEHRFKFQDSKVTPGGTTFVHEENFTGLLGFLMGDATRRTFEGLNGDLKRKAEENEE